MRGEQARGRKEEKGGGMGKGQRRETTFPSEETKELLTESMHYCRAYIRVACQVIRTGLDIEPVKLSVH